MAAEEVDEEAEFAEAVVAEGVDALEGVMPGLRALRSQPEDPDPLDALFRCFHSIKGNCAMVGLDAPSRFAHAVEDSIDVFIRTRNPITSEQVDLLEESADLLVALLNGEAENRQEEIATFLDRLGAVDGGRAASPSSTAPDKAAVPAEAPSPEAASADPAAAASKGRREDEETVRVASSELLHLEQIAGDLFHLAARLSRTVETTEMGADADSRELASSLEATTSELYGQLLEIQRVTAANLTRSLSRIVRAACRKQGKRIDFEVEGADLRVDRRALNVVRDGLVHLVRNAVDHGIERPESRVATGKPETGRIKLSIGQQEELVKFVIQDDGAGIDVERVRAKAVKLGLVTSAAAASLPEGEAIEFIFSPGFSTAAEVSELSGRGVGMNVVAEDIRNVGGTVFTETVRGAGTRFELIVPKAGSPVVDGLAVRSGESVYLLPLASVHAFVDWRDARVHELPDSPDIIAWDAGTLPLFELPRVGSVEGAGSPVAVVVEDSRSRRCAIRVEEVLGRNRVLTAPVLSSEAMLGRPVDAFVLGSGRIGCILDVDEFVGARFR